MKARRRKCEDCRELVLYENGEYCWLCDAELCYQCVDAWLFIWREVDRNRVQSLLASYDRRQLPEDEFVICAHHF